MKTILFSIAILLISLQSCVVETHTPYGYDDERPYGSDGDSYLRLNWNDEEPSYITTGGAIPNNFIWDTYYKTYSGFYTVDFEYEYYDNYIGSFVVFPYAVDIEIFEIEGQRNGNDGDDVYFDLTLYPDGGVDFFHDIHYKSDSEIPKDVTKKTEIAKKETVKNGKRMVCTLYQLPSHVKK